MLAIPMDEFYHVPFLNFVRLNISALNKCVRYLVIFHLEVKYLFSKHSRPTNPVTPDKADATQCNTTCCNNTGDASCPDVNQTCNSDASTLIPHQNTCHLYYNCSQAVSPLPTENRIYDHMPQILRPAYLHECPYPELFSKTTMFCQNYTDVKCGPRYETENKCDYLAISYFCLGACDKCTYYTPDCVGFADGIHRTKYIELYFECQNERNIYGGQNPCPTNMSPYNGKCKDLFEIQPSNWQLGYAIDCSGRPNGNYKSEHIQKCNIYYTCGC
ncbi:unnamed protein product [Mytilus coruscus]|uniref:Chitin-binding type-2 domain-containing protein n=1 Tax=Mytilus coruscus TaxID=42192 RepID=A0A6J8CA57_MYTCO|nr:unnamed protein product [Mytilus coruscus]